MTAFIAAAAAAAASTSTMASSSSTSENCYDADHTVLEPILRKLSDLQKQLSEMECSHLGDRKQGRGNHFELLPADLIYIQSAPEKLDSFNSHFKNHVNDRLSQLEKCVNDIFESVRGLRAPGSEPINTEQVQHKIHSLAISIANLKARVLLVSRVTSTAVGTDKKEKTDDTVHPHNQLFEQNSGDGYSSMFRDLVEDLDERARNLFLYFAAFPPGTIINKRVLKNWWIAEVLSQLPADEAEKKADRVLEELVLRCLIVAVRKQRRLVGFKTPHPWVHFALVSFAKKEKFFAFDDKGNATLEPNTSKGCLIKVKNVSSVDVLNRSGVDANLEKLRTLFNISEQYPHFKDEVFSKLKNVKVLSLGKWQSSNDCHIEVESTEFLKAQKSLKDLKFFSLRGVSRVSELPDALCKLSSLRILDLNACYNLEELPEGIGSLKSLIYLDISECYLLEKMPKGLASLTELRVLKGFLIIDAMEGSSSCNFKDLSGLKKLIKLGINANKKEFPTDDDLDTFKLFPLLEKLTISWGGKSLLKMLKGQSVNAERTSNPESEVQPQKANSSLKPKLELQPGEAAPCTVEDRTAELRKISDDSNPLDIADNQAGTDGAAESKLRGPGDQDDAGNVAEKVTEPTLVEGTGNTGEIIEKTEPAIEGYLIFFSFSIERLPCLVLFGPR